MTETPAPEPTPDLVPGEAPAEASAESPAEPPSIRDRVQAALPKAERWLVGAKPRTPVEELQSLAEEAARLDDSEAWDRYGGGGPVELLETRVRELLDKPAAALFPSAIMGQQSMLRAWCGQQGSNRVAIPDLSHLLRYEMDGPQLFNAFQYERLTSGPTVPMKEHLDAIPGRLGAALLELPLRDAGYLLPTWDELVEFSTAARERGVPLHFDGARLWESQPYLGHSLAEIAALADSVYVSFYKGLGGLAGAVVAGPEDVIAEARHWRSRHGGTLWSMLPYALAGLRGLRTRLPHMGAMYQRAVELAAAFETYGFRIAPQPPHTNAFRMWADVSAEEINERIVTAIETDRVVLMPTMIPGEMPNTAWTEFTVNLAALDWDVDEAAAAVGRLLSP